MDGEKQESWWFGEYPNYSLKKYPDMPIYQRFKSSDRSFNKIIGDYREAFWRDDNCFIFEWFDSKELKGEKFGLDLNSITYFYEHWFTDEENIHTVEKSWLCDPVEWGLIIKYYPDHEEQVTWNVENDQKVFEKKTTFGDQVKATKIGQVNTPQGIQDFTELFWSSPTGYGKERVWTCGDDKGEEKEYKDGEKKWGTSEVEVDDEVTKKVWNEDGNHKWGESTGEEGYEKWHEKWEKTSEGSYEELIVEDRFQNRGKLRVRSQSNNYKIEWEGTKPVITIPSPGKAKFETRDSQKDSIPLPAAPASNTKMMKKPEGKKLRSGRPGKPKSPEDSKSEKPSSKDPNIKGPVIDFPSKPSIFPPSEIFRKDPRPKNSFEEPESLVEPSGSLDPPLRLEAGKASDSEKLSAQLNSLFKDLKKDLSSRLSDLKSSEPFKSMPSDLGLLSEDLKTFKDPNPFDPQESLSAIQALRDLDRRVLASEKALLSGLPSSDQLKTLFDQSSSAVLALVPTLDPNNISGTPADLQKLLKDFENSSTPKEKIRIIAGLSPKLQDLRRASLRDAEDHEKELARVSFQMSPVLKALEKAVIESQETLLKVKSSAKDAETFEPFINGFTVRGKEWSKSLDSRPYIETVPLVAELLVDMENLKKEMLENELQVKLAEIEEKVKEINLELLERLASKPLESKKNSFNLQEIVCGLDDQVNCAAALVKKILGKDFKTGDSRIDRIPCLQNESFTVDPLELLKKIWIDGKDALGSVNKALACLAEVVCEADEKGRIGEIIERNELAVTGTTPKNKTEAFDQLGVSLDEFLPCLQNSSSLLLKLCEKVQKTPPKNPENLKNLWKSLMISEKITEKLFLDKSEDYKSPLDSLPDDPKEEDLIKSLLLSEEQNLSLLNNDSNMTESELSEIDSLANKRPKHSFFSKDKKPLLRSSSIKVPKGLKSIRGQKGSIGKTLTEPFIDLLEISFKTASELKLWVEGSKPSVSRHLESLNTQKEKLKLEISTNFEEEETLEQLLNYLKSLEDSKQTSYHSPETSKNLGILVQKSEKVLNTTSKIIEATLPSEVEEIKKRKMAENLPEYFKRIGFFLSIFFKMVKDATGVDEGGENLEDALNQMKKKQVVSMLPFEAEDLLNHLISRGVKDLKKMKFLAGLVGDEDDIEEAARLEDMAESVMPEHVSHPSAQDSLVQIDQFLHGFKEIGSQVQGKVNELIQKLVEKLVNPEPLEKDVANLITALEFQAKIAERMAHGDSLELLEDLERRKEALPGTAKDLVPYLCQLSKDFAVFVVGMLEDSLKMTRPEEQKLQFIIGKKLKAAPVLVLREVEHLFSGPDTEDMVSMIVKLNRVTDYFLKIHSIGDPALYSMCKKDFARLSSLSPVEVKSLGKDYADVLLSFIESDDSSEYIEEESSIRSKRTSLRGRPVLDWETIFRGKGLDLDPGFLTEIINQEQELASLYILNITNALGSQEIKRMGISLVDQSKEIRNDLDVKSKIENFFQLRLEESKLISTLSLKLDALAERIQELDQEKETLLTRGLAEVKILVDQNNPLLKQQVLLLVEKEQEYRSKLPGNAQEFMIRLANRTALERELQRIKEESKPADNENEEMIRDLTVVENSLYTGLRALNGFLQQVSNDLLPGTKSLKHLTEQHVSTSVPGLLASINTGLQSLLVLVQALVAVIESSPVRSTLIDLVRLIQTEMRKDDSDTEPVFANLFKLCGSLDDKNLSKKLRETRNQLPEEKNAIIDLASIIFESLGKVLPARTAQSKLQNKLVRETAKLRDGIDEIDLNDEDLVTKYIREANNSILPEDLKAKEMLEKIKKNLENISEKSPSNIPECIERINDRMKEAEKIERLRKELREKASKEINRLKGDIQDKLNEISTIKASLDAQKNNLEAQIALLSNNVNLNASLVEKLTSEAVEKDKNLSASKNSLSDLKMRQEQLEEDLARTNNELDSTNQEIRALRKANKEKDSQIRELSTSLDSFQMATDKFSLGDKEKSEILEKLREELRQLRNELEEKQKKNEQLDDDLNLKERQLKKIEIEKNSQDLELEKIKNEKNSLKAEIVKIGTDKNELEEKLKMNENSEEIRKIERILEEKQKELEESEEKLVIARRYQMLYPELILEKQENEAKLREIQIDFQEIRRKHDDLKSENDQLKFKMNSLETASKTAEELLRENQKMRLRLNFFEQSSEGRESNDLIKKISEDLSNKEGQIRDLLQEIDRLKKVIEGHVKKFRLSLTRNFLIRLCHTYKEMERQGFVKWRNFKKSSGGPSINLAPALKDLEESKDLKDEASKAADEVLMKTAADLFAHNKIIENYKEAANEKPLSFINVFKFLEELMDKKFESDKLQVSESKSVVSMPEFMMDFLLKTYGIQSLALKFLSQFIGGFYEIYKENDRYAAFFARILQIFHPEPAPLNLAVFIVKARMDFHPLIENHERSLNENERKKDASRIAFENSGHGGKAFLGDTIELVYSLFHDDPSGGESVLEMIKPEKVSIEDYVAYKICHKMAKLGKTPEMIFNLLDKDNGGSIDCKEFLSGTRVDLDLWISEKNISKLMDHLTCNKEVSKEAFMSKINMKFLLDCNKNPSWTVTKCDFLSSLLEVFTQKQRKVLKVLHEKAKPSGVFNKQLFISAVVDLDPSLDGQTIDKMYDEAKDKGPEVRLQAASEVASKYALGDLKSFKVKELLQELQRRKIVNSTEDETVSVSTKTKRISFVEGNVRIDRDEEEKTIIRKKLIKKLVKRIVG